MKKTNFLLVVFLVLTGVIGRFFLIKYVGIPNFEIITAISLVSGIYLGGMYAIAIPLLTIFLSDLAIGNNYIFIFTWTAFAIIGFIGLLYKKYRFQNSKFKIQNSFYLAIGSSIFFYLYTNFGWWLVSNMYPHTLDGLARAYVMGLPFFRNNLIGDLIFVPAFIYIAGKAFSFSKSASLEKIQHQAGNLVQ